MARSTKGAGNMLVPLGITAVLVAFAIWAALALTGEEPPTRPTIIPDEVNAERPAGAGTNPEGLADETEEGITDQLDEVDPAAPYVDTVPPAELETEASVDDAIEGETAADENTADALIGEPPLEAVDANEPRANPDEGLRSEDNDAAAEVDAAPLIDDEPTATEGDAPETDIDAETPIIDPGSATAVDDIGVVDPEVENFPPGRDAQTELTPEEGQDVVRDTDDGGTAFVPTPSGPEGRDNETIVDE